MSLGRSVKIIGEEGNVIFENLPVGLYLLIQTEAAEGYNAVSPFLVSVPLQDGAGWIYNVDGDIKTSADWTAELAGSCDGNVRNAFVYDWMVYVQGKECG